MGRPSDAYRPRDPAASALYHVVRDHFETFRAHAAGLRAGEGLPGFVEQEFRNCLRCGRLAGSFARLRCAGCRRARRVGVLVQREYEASVLPCCKLGLSVFLPRFSLPR